MATEEAAFDFDEFFQTHYARVARCVARVVGDHARAEDLAVEAFWKLWRSAPSHDEKAAWVYRTAVRLALNELRGRRRRHWYESLSGSRSAPPTPEEAHAAGEERRQVRAVLSALDQRDAEMLLLRSSGLAYSELAAAMDLNPASVGTMLGRAQKAFRKEYLKLYGERRDRR